MSTSHHLRTALAVTLWAALLTVAWLRPNLPEWFEPATVVCALLSAGVQVAVWSFGVGGDELPIGWAAKVLNAISLLSALYLFLADRGPGISFALFSGIFVNLLLPRRSFSGI